MDPSDLIADTDGPIASDAHRFANVTGAAGSARATPPINCVSVFEWRSTS
jgi:hypothetical protein